MDNQLQSSVHMIQEPKPGTVHEYIVQHMHDGCCAPWPFGTVKGRAVVTIDWKVQPAARIVCELVNGAPPSPQSMALHKCGEGHLGCINADCLYWGTHQDNMADMLTHGRSCRGELNGGGGKLTEDDVRAMRNLRTNMSVTQLAKMFGIDSTMVSRICRRKAWEHVI